MTADALHSQLAQVNSRLGLLLARYEEALSAKATLEAENEELNRENRRLAAEVDRLSADNKFLTMSHKLAQDPDNVVETRRHIAKLIRDIDRCIALLKE